MRKAQGFGSLWHLATRFFGSLLPFGPSKTSQGWALGYLLPGEAALFSSMSGPDRRHAIGVARRAIDLLADPAAMPPGPPERAFVAAGLLHDVGKIKAHLGTVGRVVATVMAVAFGRDKVVGWGAAGGFPDTTAIGPAETAGASNDRPPGLSAWSVRGWQARMGRYLMHDSIGGRLLEGAGSDDLTWKWAREHHLPESRWSVERHLGNALKEADGD
jgi:hypothetical protein